MVSCVLPYYAVTLLRVGRREFYHRDNTTVPQPNLFSSCLLSGPPTSNWLHVATELSRCLWLHNLANQTNDRMIVPHTCTSALFTLQQFSGHIPVTNLKGMIDNLGEDFTTVITLLYRNYSFLSDAYYQGLHPHSSRSHAMTKALTTYHMEGPRFW